MKIIGNNIVKQDFGIMRIFITGIAGFIGFHLALALKQQGFSVFGCDNFNDYYDPSLKRVRAKILEEQGIQIADTDICDTKTLQEHLQTQHISHLCHLAAQAGVRHSLRKPQDYVRSNLQGFVSVLEAIRSCPTIKLVYASSSSVYGSNVKVPFAENDRTDAPCSLYGATKQSNELMARAYHHLYGISVTGLRFFTVYGPWGRPDMAYYSFADAIANERPIQIFNEGRLSRDFTYIDDIVDGIIAALKLGAPCEIFNLGNNKPENILELVRLIEAKTGKQARIEYVPLQAGDVPDTYADISKSQQLLGFAPKVSLAEGMDRFLEWFFVSATGP